MKKILTLLLLSALFVVPKSMQAVVWEVSDGTVQRIKPSDPSNPNAIETIPAGTEFFRPLCAYDGNKLLVILWLGHYPRISGNGLQEGGCYYVNSRTETNFDHRSYIRCFSDLSLAYRLIERVFGYNYYATIEKNASTVAPIASAMIDYFSRCIITKEEALAVKILNLDPLQLGLYNNRGKLRTIQGGIDDLAVFENLEELYLGNNSFVFYDYSGSTPIEDLVGPPGTTSSEGQFLAQDFSFLKKLKVLDLSGNQISDFLPDKLPTTLEKLVLINCYRYLPYNVYHLDHHKLDLRHLSNLKYLDVSGLTGESWGLSLNVDSLQNLETLLVNNSEVSHLKCRYTNLGAHQPTLDLTNTRIGYLQCNDSGLENITFSQDWSPVFVECHNNNLTSLSIPNRRVLSYLDCSKNSALSGTLDMSGATSLEKLYCWNCDLTDVTLTNCGSLETLGMSQNHVLSLNVSDSPNLTEFFCNNNKRGTQQLDTITGFADLTGLQYFQCNNNAVRTLDCSRMKQLRELQVSRNNVKELVLSNNPDLKTVICDAQGGKTADGRLLSILKLDGCPALDSLVCNDNAILSLNLTASTKLTPAKMKAYTQRSVQDIVVLDRNKICIELPNGVMKTPSASQFQTWATGTSTSGFDGTRSRTLVRDGKTYVVLYDIADDATGGAQTKADVDFYNKTKRYHYTIWDSNLNESLGKSVMHGQPNDNVTVTTYPYVMYINPLTHDVYTDSVNQENQFYSGTIYLDYDAVVPEGTEVYIAQGLQYGREDMITGGDKTTSGQLNLVKIEKGEGAARVVIPALTPVYVKSPSETGLFSFDRNLDNEALGVLPAGVTYDDNIFKGTLTPLTVDPLSVLTLSRGFKSSESGPTAKSRVGFWRFNNTVVPAHRVYIEATEMDKIGGSNVRGLTFAFFDSEEELPTSINSMPTVDTFRQNNEGWYTISGVRLKAKPTAKGVYIYNGKKVIINQ